MGKVIAFRYTAQCRCCGQHFIQKYQYREVCQKCDELLEKESRSYEAANKKEISTISIVPQNDADYTDEFYILSPKADKLLDRVAPYFLIFVVIYFAAHVIWSLVR